MAKASRADGKHTKTIPHKHPAGGTASITAQREPSALRRFLKLLGPGLITGASDDDPSGIGTYSRAGASLGFATLWTAVLTLPLMAVVQFTCAKIGTVSGTGLAGVLASTTRAGCSTSRSQVSPSPTRSTRARTSAR